MQQFVHRMKQPAWNFEPLQRSDLAVVANILDKYDDQDLDFVDAAIVAIAERLNITRLLTLDHRHFRMIHPTHCAAFELLPYLAG
jgi:predicted nucleic acid-binding protein